MRRRAGWRKGCAAAVARARSRRRLSLLLGGYLALTLVMGYRLVMIQVVDAAEYRGLGDRQTQREIALAPRRGKLYDRTGEPLAMSLASATIYADPRQLRTDRIDPYGVAAQLAPLLDRPVASLVDALRADASFVYLARQVPRQVGEQVAALRLPGVGVLSEARRVYPADGLAAQVVGFAGIDGTGLAGLEAGLDDVLSGEPGRLRLERAPRGLEISAAPREVTPPIPGRDVVLTLDREIQAATERVLREAVRRNRAKGGSAVVLDVPTGEVLAMASLPTYRPDDIAAARPDARRNRAATDVYEPGSVNKVITAAAALEDGLVTPNERIRVPDGYKVGWKRFSDAHPAKRTKLTFRRIIERSSNVGTIKVAERVGPQRLYRYLQRFGYGRPTGSGFPGESAGLLAAPADWSNTSLPTIAIGQGVSATLLQVAGVFETIATGGEWVQPTLVRGVLDDDGRLDPAPASPRRRAVSERTARTIADMLVSVVEGRQGTCPLCAVPGYRVGGKTGTAQKPSEKRRGYERGAYVGSFVGFAPAEDPALVVGVTLDEPRPVYYGGLTAGPAFAEIMDFALSHRRVPPSDPHARATAQPAAAADTAAAPDGPPAPVRRREP